MLIFVKQLLKPQRIQTDVEILGQIPCLSPLTYGFNYQLVKRGDYYYAVYCDAPNYGSTTTAVQTLNFIQKTQDFVNWTGSGIGSGYTVYDENADSFFSVTLGLNYTTNVAAYHVTKINPDTFSYVNKTIMGDTALTVTSRLITGVRRLGNNLVIHYYRDSTNLYSYYSSNNGSSWSNSRLYSISSFGIGGFGQQSASTGSKMLIRGYYGSTSHSVRCFTTPTTSVASNSVCLYSDKPILSKGTKAFYVVGTTLKVCNDGVNDIAYTIKNYTAQNYGVFYGNYFISSYIGGASGDYSTIGKITVFDTSTLQTYTYETGLDLRFERASGSTVYHYGFLRIVGFIENQVYFSYQLPNNNKYFFARVPLSSILENMQLCN